MIGTPEGKKSKKKKEKRDKKGVSSSGVGLSSSRSERWASKGFDRVAPAPWRASASVAATASLAPGSCLDGHERMFASCLGCQLSFSRPLDRSSPGPVIPRCPRQAVRDRLGRQVPQAGVRSETAVSGACVPWLTRSLGDLGRAGYQRPNRCPRASMGADHGGAVGSDLREHTEGEDGAGGLRVRPRGGGAAPSASGCL